MKKIILLLCIALFSITSFGQGQKSSTQGEFNLFSESNVKAAELEYDEVTDGDLIYINLTELAALHKSAPSQFNLKIPLSDDNSMELVLERIQVFAQGFKVETSTGKGMQDVDFGVHYKGTIVGQSTSFVSLSVYNDEIVGLFSDSKYDYELVQLKDHASRYIFYKTANLQKHIKDSLFKIKCYIEDDSKDMPVYTDAQVSNSNRSHDCQVVQVYLVADYSYYLLNGSDADETTNKMISAFAQTINAYNAEDIYMVLSGVFVWDSEDSFDQTAETEDQLDDFRDYYNGDGAGWSGDLASLISGQSGNWGGGIAYLNGLCTSDSYALTRIGIDAPILPWTSHSRYVKVLTHEIGHNLNSRHTHACVWNGDNTQIDDYGNVDAIGAEVDDADGVSCLSEPYLLDVFPTIMSYFDSLGHGTFPISNGMGTQPGNVMRDYVANASCLTNGSEIPPIAVCQDITIQLDNNGNASITAEAVDNGSYDACGGVPSSLSLSQSSFDCSNIGENVVTLNVTDSDGNVGTCNATITVEDKIAPVITCPSDLTIECDESTAPANTGSATATDNCDATPTITFSDVSNLNGCGGSGTITRTWKATDTSGIFSTCIQTITVIDTTPPNAICQDITVQLGDNEMVTITADQIDNGSNDTCGNVTLAIDVALFTCFQLGDHIVNLTVTDECGNQSSCAATVSVVGPDEDCDTVADICDECPGGNDTVDNNGDGLPDCAYYPGFENLIDEWKCGNRTNKVVLCHISPDNPDMRGTLCVSPEAVAEHLAHGDYLGPCDDANCDTEREILSGAPSDKGSKMQIEVIPNPVNENTTITIRLPQNSDADIEIYNFVGQRVYQLHSGMIEAPMHQFEWNGASKDGSKLQSGIYFIVLKSNGQWITKKVSIQ